MKTLNTYLIDRFVGTFAITLTAVTFIMCLSFLLAPDFTDLLAQGIPWQPVALLFLSAMPPTLTLSIPISTVVSCLLTFERISRDNEIVAMKASGVSMWQVCSRPILFAVFLSVVCLFLGSEWAPLGHALRKKTGRKLAAERPVDLIEPGRFIRHFDGMTFRIGNRSGNRIYDVIIYDQRPGEIEREVRAGAGVLKPSKDGASLTIQLFDGVRVDPLFSDREGAGFMQSYTITIDTSDLLMGTYRRKTDDMTLAELLERMLAIPRATIDAADRAYRCTLAVEINQRIVMSLSCLAFVLIGMPLGVQTRRSSLSVGVLLSLLIVISFYLVVLLVRALEESPAARPDIIIWAPVVVFSGLGAYLIHRIR